MIKKFKKEIPMILLACSTMLVTLASCGSKKDDSISVMIPFQKESFQKFFDTFSKNNEDVEFNFSAYRGGSASAYILKCFEANDLSDVIITSYPPDGSIQEDTLLDLSGYNFVQNYKKSVLNNLSVDGKIYLLECPSSVRGIAYNKTIFSEKGWSVPKSHQEFIDLIAEIKTDGTYVPLGVQGKYPGAYFTLMSELSYCDFLQTPEGEEWMQKFAKGEAKAEDGFKYGMNLLKDWKTAGAFDDEDQKSLGDSKLYEKFVENRWCAMSYVMGSQNKLVEYCEASEDEFGMFPIYGSGEDSEFVATTYGVKVGLNKSLGEAKNKKKLAKALKILEFLSTTEGQMEFHTGRGDILPLVGSKTSLSSMFDDLVEVVERGHSAPFLYPGYEDILAPTGEYLRKAFYDGSLLDEAFTKMDELRANSLANKSNYEAIVSETLSEDETAQYIANVLQAQEYGDIALVSKGTYTRYFDVAGGANGKLYEGGIATMDVNMPLCNVAAQDTVIMELTGAKIKELLKTGRVLKDDEGHVDSYDYFSAGIDVNVDKEGNIESVLFEGSPLEDTKTYKVVFSPSDYSEDIALIGNPQESGTPWEEDYLAYINKEGTITPEHAKKQ